MLTDQSDEVLSLVLSFHPSVTIKIQLKKCVPLCEWLTFPRHYEEATAYICDLRKMCPFVLVYNSQVKILYSIFLLFLLVFNFFLFFNFFFFLVVFYLYFSFLVSFINQNLKWERIKWNMCSSHDSYFILSQKSLVISFSIQKCLMRFVRNKVRRTCKMNSIKKFDSIEWKMFLRIILQRPLNDMKYFDGMLMVDRLELLHFPPDSVANRQFCLH